MSRFKKKEYKCVLCGSIMERVDEEVLVCPNPKCNHSVEVKDYITDILDYDEIYGGIRAEDKFEEIVEPYDEVYDED